MNSTTCGTPAAHYWSGLGELRKWTSFVQAQIWTNCFFFQIPQILSASGQDVIHVLGPIPDLGFLLWHLWLSHPPRTRVNTCAQCVHLTNPCTNRKVLSLTKLKGKIYKTKNDNIKKIPPQLYYTSCIICLAILITSGKIIVATCTSSCIIWLAILITSWKTLVRSVMSKMNDSTNIWRLWRNGIREEGM